jgi:hypothetical protein
MSFTSQDKVLDKGHTVPWQIAKSLRKDRNTPRPEPDVVGDAKLKDVRSKVERR